MYKSGFLVKFIVSLILNIYTPRVVPWLHSLGRNARNVANRVKKLLMQWAFKYLLGNIPWMIVTLMELRQPKIWLK